MNGLGKILSRYVFSAAGVGLLLLLFNLALVILFTITVSQNSPVTKDRLMVIAAGVEREADGTFSVSPQARQALDERYAWAMQLSENGDVIWRDRLPEGFEEHYTASQIAAFSRWYLHDYPVYVWSDADGLLVVASSLGSEWKYPVTMSNVVIEIALRWLPMIFVFNLLAALSMALLLGWRLFVSLRPVALAIDQLADGQSIHLPEQGLLVVLSANLNRASQRLSQQKALLDKRDRTRTQWIAGVSHDIRTPLAVVQASAAQIAADSSLKPHLQQKAQLIIQQSQRLGQLISDLNLTSKLSYQMQPLTVSLLRPAELLRTAAAAALNETQRDIALELFVPPELEALEIKGDASLLNRALANLLRNSIIHAPDPLCITLRLATQGSLCIISLTDNGPGLPADVLSRLREPTPQELPAHGLGLILVEQILAAHQGSVSFQNLTPRGLLVMLYLPQV